MPERFLHYRPPGSSVGDAGELSPGSRHEAGAVDLGSIRELLRRWADTLLRGDLRGHVSLYAPAGRDTVLARKQQLLNGLPAVRRFEVYDLQLQQSRDGSVQAKFRVASDAGRSLEGRYVLELRRIGGAWRIVAEQR